MMQLLLWAPQRNKEIKNLENLVIIKVPERDLKKVGRGQQY